MLKFNLLFIYADTGRRNGDYYERVNIINNRGSGT